MYAGTVFSRYLQPCASDTQAICASFIGGYEQAGQDDLSVRSRTGVFNASADLAQASLFGGADRLNFGVLGLYARTFSSGSSSASSFGATGGSEGGGAGVYANWFQDDATRLGLALKSWGAFGAFSNNVDEAPLPAASYASWAGALSLEADYAVRIGPAGGAVIVQPEAQIVYAGYGQDRVIESDGAIVSAGASSGVQSRLGILGSMEFHPSFAQLMRISGDISWWHLAEPQTVFFDGLPQNALEPRNRIEAGLTANAEITPKLDLFMTVQGDVGDERYRALRGIAGLTLSF
jgi:autotransporter family porin